MIITEEETKNIGEKRVLLQGRFKYFDQNDKVEMWFDCYYDAGEGFIDPYECKDFDFLSEVKNQVYENNKDMLLLNQDNQFIIESRKKYDITDEKKRMLFVKELYSIGVRLDYPIFLQIDDDYFYMNELRFIDFDKDKEDDLVWNKYEELFNFISQKMYGEEYQYFKKEEKLHKMIHAHDFDDLNKKISGHRM